MPCPLVVDLDGTLLKSDVLYLSFFSYSKRNVPYVLVPLVWLLQSKALLKSKLAEHAPIDVTVLPYDEKVLSFLKKEKEKNRNIVLATASHITYATQIAEHLGLFDTVMATDSKVNLSSHKKQKALVAKFGEKGFDYIGNSRADLVIWQSARKAYLVNPERGVEQRAKKNGNVEKVFISRKHALQTWLKALRPHQWLKNLLIFIPLLAAHEFTNLPLATQALLAFLFFSLCASSAYLLNDLVDLEDDIHHSRKKHRPLTSGDLSIKAGAISIPLLFLAAFTGSLLMLPWQFTASLGVYYTLTLLYSFLMKRIAALDIISLAVLYTMRIIAGSFACGLVPTFWILAFSMFLFLSLALVKRYAELHDACEKGKTEKTKGRGYFPGDLGIISSLGTASGYLSVMVLALYIQDAKTLTLYSNPEIIWLACPLLLYWISRIWILTHRGHMHDDPVLFAVKDKTSLIVGVFFASVFVFAL